MKPNYAKATYGQGSSIKEENFLNELEKLAGLQKILVETEMLPAWARGVGDWLVVHPWRVIVPMSAIIYVFVRVVGGSELREFVLALFGGFR